MSGMHALQCDAEPSRHAPDPSAEGTMLDRLQFLVDQAALFNAFVVPGPPRAAIARCSGSVTEFAGREIVRRFEINLDLPTSGREVRAVNTLGEAAGVLDLRLIFIPGGFAARPDREPPPVALDPAQSQRFALQEATFRFGAGGDGFRSFGTGRTFPTVVAGRPRLAAAAIGNLTEGFGKFRGREGNYTFCGDLDPERGFSGHVIFRIVDADCSLRRGGEDLPVLQAVPDADPAVTFLAWTGQKGKGPDQENRFSLDPNGEVRGMNIPTQLKPIQVDFSAQGSDGFRVRCFRTGPVVGREIGFGRGSEPGADPAGTPWRPFLFEGVARYSFNDERGRELGAITTNVLEGRRFDMKLTGAPAEPALRFGFFGPIVAGTGCFRGASGLFFGATGSIFKPPPGEHVITHYYAARIHDPEGNFRSR
jgi:hypothetical protein